MNYSRDICAPIADQIVNDFAGDESAEVLPADAGESVAGKTFLGANRRWIRTTHRGKHVLLAVTIQLFSEGI